MNGVYLSTYCKEEIERMVADYLNVEVENVHLGIVIEEQVIGKQMREVYVPRLAVVGKI